MGKDVSASLQDYLEAVFILSEHHGGARITDIAEFLGVAKASVVQAIRSLKENGLVTQRRYGLVELTPEGKKLAVNVRDRHMLFRKLLVEILGVTPEIAERDACAMEHAVSLETVEKLAQFVDFYEAWRKGERELMPQVLGKTLDTLQVGERGRVIRVTAQGPVQQRILEMGITPGVELEVTGVAPLGDPLKVCVKGYTLTLRREEASKVVVELF
ncbi:MAG: metal-dependent transcriptional regulator [Candidatus Caldatribacterium sp.]|uniref:metal-dependent transcriptional regulator n=1 Tax=Candidatus Caldatribacterium sp. TaxID=2282143 RepID=UPI002999E39B|nr:metal-dependent transcriptional regulator [Candidatus Caldatribacterium sp.]MCX7730402.1 metal-dependent transcriptional regulator [Candidatus Caldatribacterium sp.]MDW8081878.1 metal-dependent transcriptional regulator [Candidatus Calescibacterium sp.]